MGSKKGGTSSDSEMSLHLRTTVITLLAAQSRRDAGEM